MKDETEVQSEKERKKGWVNKRQRQKVKAETKERLEKAAKNSGKEERLRQRESDKLRDVRKREREINTDKERNAG